MTESRELTFTWTLEATPAEAFPGLDRPRPARVVLQRRQPIPDDPIELDLRVGGVWRQRMVIIESTDYVTGGVYREIVPDEKLVFARGATDGWPELDPERGSER